MPSAYFAFSARGRMVNVGLVAVDGMKMGCPAALAANGGRKHIDARSPRPRALFGTDGRGGEPPAQLRECAAGRRPVGDSWPRRLRDGVQKYVSQVKLGRLDDVI